MNSNKNRLIEYAKELCLPALKKGIESFNTDKIFLVTDHVGYSVTLLEELLRPLWGISPLLNSEGAYAPLCMQIRQIILEGTDEKSGKCFSRFVKKGDEESFANQVITEFAGYMLAVVFAKEVLWDPYSEEEKNQVASFIKKWSVIALKYSWPNNHYWFPMLSIIALEKIGIDCSEMWEEMQKGFSVLDKMYISDGWYKDGEFGRFDYYLAWSHHVYPALWYYLSQGTNYFDEKRAQTYKARTEEFLKFYVHVFDSEGAYVPFGRSLSYRFAATAIFPAAAMLGCNIPYGMCRKLMFDNIEYFLKNSIPTEDGVLGAGYLYDSPSLVENYTSQGGAYWCSKAFLALMIEDGAPFWCDEEESYPAKLGEYLIKSPVKNINVMVENCKNSGVTMYNNTISYVQNGVFTHHFNDMGACYSKFVYNSKAGFALSASDNKSLDNMISLSTKDATMFSARTAFSDLGITDGIMVSEHIPFSNDKGSSIKTWILPLGNGFHIRAHRITLSNEYRIIEGGFSLGYFDDNNTFTANDKGACVMRADGAKSRMYTVSGTPFKYVRRNHHPGMHIMAPQSAYPAFETDVLPKGIYYFVSAFALLTDEEMPCICVENDICRIKYRDLEKTIKLR